MTAPPSRPPSIWRRLRSPRTLASFALAAALLGLLLWRLDPETLAAAGQLLREARLGWYLAALGAYYLAFPIRGLRWKILLLNAGEPEERIARVPVLAEIIYLSWFANAIVPAKLGDLWRGWLAQKVSGTRWARAMGTIVAERVLDFVVLVVLMVSTGFLTYGEVLTRGVSGGLRACLLGGVDASDLGCTLAQLFALGTVVVLGVLIGMVLVARYADRFERFLPESVARVYAMFSEALVLSFGRFGPLLSLTVLAWVAEGASFYLVGRALGLSLGLPLVIFFSLLQAFLTVIPATPGGLGFEFILAAAIGLLGFGAAEALALTALYRTISYLSLVIGGALVFLFSPLTK